MYFIVRVSFADIWDRTFVYDLAKHGIDVDSEEARFHVYTMLSIDGLTITRFGAKEVLI
jgi:hypothetical protein